MFTPQRLSDCLGMGMGRNRNWPCGNEREWECKKPFPIISSRYLWHKCSSPRRKQSSKQTGDR